MRPRRALTLALAITALVPAHAAAATCPGADLPPTASNLATVEQATLCLLNQQRTAAGLAPVSRNAQLDAASRAHSQDMVTRKYFAHDTPDGVSFLDRETTVGYINDSLWSWNAGENIAWGAGYLAPASQIMTAWMNSQHHRENILDPDFKEIGVGVAMGVPVAGSALGATYTTDFGARALDTSDSDSSTAAAKAKKAKKAKKARRCSHTAKRARAHKSSRSRKTRSKKASCGVKRSAKKSRPKKS
jgi:uncharacterized protein YkwD